MACRIYIGNLPLDIRESELDDLFYKYGKIKEIDLKTPARPPAFAFITFADHRDAEDAIHGRDGHNYDGYRLRCEFAKGDRRGGGGGEIDRYRGEPRRGGTGGGRRTDYGVTVTNLPRGCSWQDLKDFMRKAGDVVFTDVDKYGDGVVEFSNRDDMEYAISKFDDTEFKGHSDSSYIRVKLANKGRDRSVSRSPVTRGRARSPSRSPVRGRARSPSRSVSRSRSRSRDRERVSKRDTRDDIDDVRADVRADDDAEVPPETTTTVVETAVPSAVATAVTEEDPPKKDDDVVAVVDDNDNDDNVPMDEVDSVVVEKVVEKDDPDF